VAKHSRPPEDNDRRGILWALLALLGVVLVAGAFWFLGGDDDDPAADAPDPAPTTTEPAPSDDAAVTSDPPPAAAPESCDPVTVWSAPELLPAVTAAADRAADDCFTYDVQERETATSQAEVRGEDAPDVWLPSSVAWAQLAARDGVDLQVGPTVASSPVLLTGAPGTVAGMGDLGLTPDSSFAELAQVYQEQAATGDAQLTMRLGDPRNDPATMALLAATSEELGSLDEPGGPGRSLLVVLAQTAAQGDPLSVLRSDADTLVPATEQQIGTAVADGQELQGVQLGGDLGTVQLPFVRVGQEGSEEAVAALQEELTSGAADGDLAESFLRPGDEGAAPGVPGVPERVRTTGEAPDEQLTATVAETWSVIAPQSRILALIDISGSMEAPVDDDATRIDLTREAAQTALSVIPERTAVGVWYFATSLDGERDHVEAAPLRPLEEEVGDVTHKEVLLGVTEELGVDTLQGDTGLHDSLWAAYSAMQEEDVDDAISSVLMLTDGINDDSTGGLSEDEVVERLEQAREEGDRQVTVVLIGVGPDVDADALERLATAAGGESLVITDPRELPQVFVDVVARRAA
jgi:Mg-chelatase subunit ChlD